MRTIKASTLSTTAGETACSFFAIGISSFSHFRQSSNIFPNGFSPFKPADNFLTILLYTYCYFFVNQPNRKINDFFRKNLVIIYNKSFFLSSLVQNPRRTSAFSKILFDFVQKGPLHHRAFPKMQTGPDEPPFLLPRFFPVGL